MTMPATDEQSHLAAPGPGDANHILGPPGLKASLPSGSRSGGERLWVAPAKVGLLTAAGTAAIALVNPSDSGFAVCWSQQLGFDCPFCGGLRTVTSLAHGNFLAALDHNIILAIALPVTTVLWAVWMVLALRNRQFRLPRIPNWVVATAGIAILAFTVARNLDGPAWVQYLASSSYH
ncbi:MAG: DUF2752 domain-containing protein [Microthrixaceae bacterium]